MIFAAPTNRKYFIFVFKLVARLAVLKEVRVQAQDQDKAADVGGRLVAMALPSVAD